MVNGQMFCPNCGEIDEKDTWTHVKRLWDYEKNRWANKKCRLYCMKCGALLAMWGDYDWKGKKGT